MVRAAYRTVLWQAQGPDPCRPSGDRAIPLPWRQVRTVVDWKAFVISADSSLARVTRGSTYPPHNFCQ